MLPERGKGFLGNLATSAFFQSYVEKLRMTSCNADKLRHVSLLDTECIITDDLLFVDNIKTTSNHQHASYHKYEI